MINTIFFFKREVWKNKKWECQSYYNRKFRLSTPKYATKNKLIVSFNNLRYLIFFAEYKKCQKLFT